MRIMVLTDGKRIKVTEQQEQFIVKEMNNVKDERIKVNGVLYKKSLIGYFDTPNQAEIESSRRNDPWAKKAIPSGKECNGQRSIQREINNIAQREGGKNWATLIRDKSWREDTRQLLRQGSTAWCDYKAGECACV